MKSRDTLCDRSPHVDRVHLPLGMAYDVPTRKDNETRDYGKDSMIE